MGASGIELIDDLMHGGGDVALGGMKPPLGMGEQGESEEAADDGFILQGARGTMGFGGDVMQFELLFDGEAEGIGKEGDEDDDFCGGNALFDQVVDFICAPLQHLRIEGGAFKTNVLLPFF